MKKMPKFDGPIPGENFTADTRNFPWHRPPDETDYVSIVEKAIDHLSQPDVMGVMLTALESGDTILDYVTGTARVSVGNGKLPIDQAVLAAGPIARFVESVAVRAGVNFERGWDENPPIITPEYVRGMDPNQKVERTPAPMEEAPQEESFMSMGSKDPATSETQNKMLGGE